MITPLRQTTPGGELYERDKSIEASLVELAALPSEDLIARCDARSRSDPRYVPSECLLYFVSASRNDNSEFQFERLYKLLLKRLIRVLPKPNDSFDNTGSLRKERVRDKVLGRQEGNQRCGASKLEREVARAPARRKLG